MKIPAGQPAIPPIFPYRYCPVLSGEEKPKKKEEKPAASESAKSKKGSSYAEGGGYEDKCKMHRRCSPQRSSPG